MNLIYDKLKVNAKKAYEELKEYDGLDRHSFINGHIMQQLLFMVKERDELMETIESQIADKEELSINDIVIKRQIETIKK